MDIGGRSSRDPRPPKTLTLGLGMPSVDDGGLGERIIPRRIKGYLGSYQVRDIKELSRVGIDCYGDRCLWLYNQTVNLHPEVLLDVILNRSGDHPLTLDKLEFSTCPNAGKEAFHMALSVRTHENHRFQLTRYLGESIGTATEGFYRSPDAPGTGICRQVLGQLLKLDDHMGIHKSRATAHYNKPSTFVSYDVRPGNIEPAYGTYPWLSFGYLPDQAVWKYDMRNILRNRLGILKPHLTAEAFDSIGDAIASDSPSAIFQIIDRRDLMTTNGRPIQCPDGLESQFHGKKMILPNRKTATVAMALFDGFSYACSHNREDPNAYTRFRKYVGA